MEIAAPKCGTLQKTLLILLLLHFCAVHGKRPYMIDVSQFDCTLKNPLLLRKLECSVSQTANAPARLNGEFVLGANLTAFTMRLTFDMFRKDNSKINLMNVNLTGCRFLEASYENPLMQIGLRELHRASNLPRKCPVLAGVKYSIANYTIDPEDFPPFSPMMSWILMVQFWIKDKLQGNLIISGTMRKVK